MKKKLLFVLFTILTLSNYLIAQTFTQEKFESFWSQTYDELNDIPILVDTISTTIKQNKEISLLKIKSFNNIEFHMWVSQPKHIGKYVTKISFSGFGRGNTDKSNIPSNTFIIEENTINIIVDIRGQGLSTDIIKFENYLTKGISSKETYIYRGAFMDAVRAVDVASLNINSNGEIIVIGGSQGGLLSIVATALNSKVDLCIANFPFYADLKSYNKNGWPLNSMIRDNYESLMDVLLYYDAVNFAKLINVPVFISCGEKDNITPYLGALKVYKNLENVDKLFFVVPCEGHGCSSKSQFSEKIKDEFILNHTK